MRADQPSSVMGAAPFALTSYPACVSAYLSSRCCPLVVGGYLQANNSSPYVLQLQQTELCATISHVAQTCRSEPQPHLLEHLDGCACTQLADAVMAVIILTP